MASVLETLKRRQQKASVLFPSGGTVERTISPGGRSVTVGQGTGPVGDLSRLTRTTGPDLIPRTATAATSNQPTPPVENNAPPGAVPASAPAPATPAGSTTANSMRLEKVAGGFRIIDEANTSGFHGDVLSADEARQAGLTIPGSPTGGASAVGAAPVAAAGADLPDAPVKVSDAARRKLNLEFAKKIEDAPTHERKRSLRRELNARKAGTTTPFMDFQKKANSYDEITASGAPDTAKFRSDFAKANEGKILEMDALQARIADATEEEAPELAKQFKTLSDELNALARTQGGEVTRVRDAEIAKAKSLDFARKEGVRLKIEAEARRKLDQQLRTKKDAREFKRKEKLDKLHEDDLETKRKDRAIRTADILKNTNLKVEKAAEDKKDDVQKAGNRSKEIHFDSQAKDIRADMKDIRTRMLAIQKKRDENQDIMEVLDPDGDGIPKKDRIDPDRSNKKVLSQATALFNLESSRLAKLELQLKGGVDADGNKVLGLQKELEDIAVAKEKLSANPKPNAPVTVESAVTDSAKRSAEKRADVASDPDSPAVAATDADKDAWSDQWVKDNPEGNIEAFRKAFKKQFKIN